MQRTGTAARLGALFAAAWLALLSSVAAFAAPASPSLLVDESAALARKQWPVTIGVPLPNGWVNGGQSVRVVDAKTSKPIPTQSRVLADWPGGRGARWLLVDFQTDLASRGKIRMSLQAGSPPAPKVKVDVQQRGSDVEIDNGVLHLLVGKGSGGLFRLQSLHGKAVSVEPVRGEMKLKGAAVAASPPEQVTVEDRGPLRAAVRLRGHYGGGFDYEVRLQVYAGQPFVRLQHTWIDVGSDELTQLEHLSLTVPAPGAAERKFSALLGENERLSGDVSAAGVIFTQVDQSTFRRDGESRTGRLGGWFELRSASFSIGLDAPFFWQEYPQAARLLPSGLQYDLWAEGVGTAQIGVGAAKTHELAIVFGTGDELVREPLRGTTAYSDPTWTANSGALLNAVDPVRERAFVEAASSAFDRMRKSLDVEVWDEAGACADPKAHPEPAPKPESKSEIRRTGAYGMLNWGDWNYRGYHDDTKGCDAWGNQEYDLTQVLGLLFAATGRSQVRELLTASARHFGEVDVIHHQPRHPEWVGMNHPKNPQHFSFEYGGVDLGHTWVEGLFTYYFLTGEPRAREAALGIADYLVQRLRRAMKGNPRQFGWPAMALAAAYEATGKQEYRSGALEYAQLGIDKHPVPERIGKDWKLGILGDAVTYVQAVSPQPALQGWLDRYATAVIASEAKDVRYYPGVAGAAHLAKNRAWGEAARSAAGRISFGDWAKPFTIGSRNGFRILSQLDTP